MVKKYLSFTALVLLTAVIFGIGFYGGRFFERGSDVPGGPVESVIKSVTGVVASVDKKRLVLEAGKQRIKIKINGPVNSFGLPSLSTSSATASTSGEGRVYLSSDFTRPPVTQFDLWSLKPGQKVSISLAKQADGTYRATSVAVLAE